MPYRHLAYCAAAPLLQVSKNAKVAGDAAKGAVDLAKPYVEKATPVVKKAAEEVVKTATPVRSATLMHLPPHTPQQLLAVGTMPPLRALVGLCVHISKAYDS